jgi:hypothetical protein
VRFVFEHILAAMTLSDGSVFDQLKDPSLQERVVTLQDVRAALAGLLLRLRRPEARAMPESAGKHVAAVDWWLCSLATTEWIAAVRAWRHERR